MSFSTVSNALIRDATVSRDARFLWVVLRSYSNAQGKRCFPGIAALCVHMGCKERLIHSCLRELVAAQFLTYVSGKTAGSNGTNSYTLRTSEHTTPQVSGGDTSEVGQSITSIHRAKRPKDPRRRTSVKSDWSDGLGMQGGDGFRNAKGPPPENELPSQTA